MLLAAIEEYKDIWAIHEDMTSVHGPKQGTYGVGVHPRPDGAVLRVSHSHGDATLILSAAQCDELGEIFAGLGRRAGGREGV